MPTPKAGNPSLTQITIDGVDVKSYTKYGRGWDDRTNSYGVLVLVISKKVSAVITLSKNSIGNAVVFSRGIRSSTEDYRFRGEIEDVKERPGWWIITANNKLYRAQKDIQNQIYNESDIYEGKPHLIWKNLMTTSGVPVDDNYITEATGIVINQFYVDDARPLERADDLVSGVLFRHYYDPNADSAVFEPKGAVSSNIILTVGDQIINAPEWDNRGRELVQNVKVRGASEEVFTTDTFSPNGSTTRFTMPALDSGQSPQSINVDIDGTEQTLGIKDLDADSSFDYYVDQNEIVFNIAPSGSTGTISYSYLVERPVTMQSPSSIANYATVGGVEYPYKDVYTLPDKRTVDDAMLVAQAILDEQSVITPGTRLAIRNVANTRVNHEVRVIDQSGDNNFDETLHIDRYEYRYPYNYDVITVSDEAITDVDVILRQEQRIKRLEEWNSKGKKVVIDVKAVGRKVGAGRRVFTKESRQRDVSKDGFILDHPVYGVLDSAALDATDNDDFFDTWVIDERTPAKGVWDEWVRDQTHYDSGNSTNVTWDNTDHEIQLGSSATYQSELIAKGTGVGNYTKIKVDFGTLSGGSATITIAEEDTFTTTQSITEGTETTLTIDITNGLYLKIEGTSIVVAVELNAYNVQTHPAIRVTLTE